MSSFQVPGWSMPDAPVQENRDISPKKRKRPLSDGQSLEVNFDKIMEKLKSTVGADEKKKPQRKKSPRKNKRDKLKPGGKATSNDLSTRNISRPKPLKPFVHTDGESSRPSKRVKTHHEPTQHPNTTSSTLAPPSTGLVSKLTALQQGMRHSLDGARFRIINETLYKSESGDAQQLMRQDPKVFEEYHVGFRRQVRSWPTNPVQHYISALSPYPPRTVIADLGCGDAALAKTLIPKGLSVLSYDLVSDNEYVIGADVFERIPLPGSEGAGKEKTHGTAQVVDVVVCALSLMGTNWPKCLREAWRILKAEGELKIAEVTSRFTNVQEFLSLVGDVGFRLKSKDESNTHFTLFEFKKVARRPKSDDEWESLVSRGHILKPCEYKRR